MSVVTQLESAGFALRESVLSEAGCERLLAAFADWSQSHRHPAGAGVRNLLRDLPAVGEVAASQPVRNVVAAVLGAAAFPVRALWFDKTPEANWKVPWHQDLAIAVAERREVPSFTGWSVKDGVPHVHPPSVILERMITVRLHLDACGPDNGPLRVLPGSHRGGRLTAADIAVWRERTDAVECVVPRGGALLICPLLLHASSAALRPGHRRVLHLEFAAEELPGGLRWAFRPTSAPGFP
jgi:hypothetical protein